MKCVNCYQDIPDNSEFCPYCGAQQEKTQKKDSEGIQQPYVPYEPQPQEEKQDSPQQAKEEKYDSPRQAQETGQDYSYQQEETRNQQPYTAYQPDVPAKPVNWIPYLVLSIVSTVCCCPPFGIAAIVFSSKIESKISAGKPQEAQDAAKKAKIWIIVAFAAGILSAIIMFFAAMLLNLDGSYYYYYY